MVALCVAGVGLFPAQPVAGQETAPGAIRGAAAVEQLKQDGQIEVDDSDTMYPLTIDPLFFPLQQKLLAADGVGNDYFGASVALSGDTLAVGAVRDDIGANVDQGSVYVFTRSGAVWTLQQKLTANDGVAHNPFGQSVAIGGDTLVVGAGTSAYVFTRSGATWTQQQILTPGDSASVGFGHSVALSGNTLVVGAPGDSVSSMAAYVFMRSEKDGRWR